MYILVIYILIRDDIYKATGFDWDEGNKAIPSFPTEEEERTFWATHDSTEFVNWDDAAAIVLPHLKPSTKSISLRLPESMLDQLRMIANKRDVPYQSLIKLFLKERIDQELRLR